MKGRSIEQSARLGTTHHTCPSLAQRAHNLLRVDRLSIRKGAKIYFIRNEATTTHQVKCKQHDCAIVMSECKPRSACLVTITQCLSLRVASNDAIDNTITSKLDYCYECIRTGMLIRTYYKVRSVLSIDYEMRVDERAQAHQVTT